jgi:hypothetical protein
VQILQPTTHAQRYAAMRQINGMSIVKPTAIFETKSPWVSMVLLERFAVQFLQARVREGGPFRQPLSGLLPEILERFQIVDDVCH